MNCFCDLFQNEVVWLIIIALIILFAVCGNGFGCGGCGGCWLNKKLKAVASQQPFVCQILVWRVVDKTIIPDETQFCKLWRKLSTHISPCEGRWHRCRVNFELCICYGTDDGRVVANDYNKLSFIAVESVFSEATTPPPRLFGEPRSPAPLKGRINIRVASSNYQNFVFNYPLNRN